MFYLLSVSLASVWLPQSPAISTSGKHKGIPVQMVSYIYMLSKFKQFIFIAQQMLTR